MKTEEPESAKTCEHCGASMVEYRHYLLKGMVQGLAKLAAAGGGPLNLNILDLTRNQWDNFQKLKYFDLVSQRDRGIWEITSLGLEFLAGTRRVHRRATTYRGEVVGRDGVLVAVSDVDGGYLTCDDYIEESRAVA